MIKGPIIIVDDDKDDRELYEECLRAIGISNKILYFGTGKDALNYLIETEDQPFIIISDVNLPGMTGLELKRQIQDDPFLCTKGIPFVFLSTHAGKVSVRHAHALSVQGYFVKPSNVDGVKRVFRMIFEYWEECKHINNT